MNTTDNLTIRVLCPLPHRGHAPPIDPPATICTHHTRQLRDHLTDITRWWDTLPDLAQSGRDGGGGCGLNSQPPVRLDILALTDPHTRDDGDIPPAARILVEVANWIATQRRLTAVYSPTAALRLLNTHSSALTDHPDPQAVHGPLTRIWLHLRRLAGEARHTVATCQEPHPDPQVDGKCGGAITWTGRQTGVIAVCGNCGDTWTDSLVLLYEQQTRMAIERQETA